MPQLTSSPIFTISFKSNVVGHRLNFMPPIDNYDALMHEICVGLGFCGRVKRGSPLHVSNFIPVDGKVTADQFTEWVFLADNLNPNTDKKNWCELKDKIKNAFVRHMGSDIVDAQRLTYGDLEENGGDLEENGPVGSPYLLYRKIEVLRQVSIQQARRYSCVQYIKTGEYIVLSADWIDPDRENTPDQNSKFIKAFLALDRDDPGSAGWSCSLDQAIACFDDHFETQSSSSVYYGYLDE